MRFSDCKKCNDRRNKMHISFTENLQAQDELNPEIEPNYMSFQGLFQTSNNS